MRVNTNGNQSRVNITTYQFVERSQIENDVLRVFRVVRTENKSFQLQNGLISIIERYANGCTYLL